MSSNDSYTPHPNSTRLPFYGMVALSIISCIIFWRSCKFSGTSMDAPAPAVEAAPAQ